MTKRGGSRVVLLSCAPIKRQLPRGVAVVHATRRVFRFILPEDGSLNVPANASIRCEGVLRASQCLLISESDLWPATPCSRSERWAVRLPPDSRVHLLPAVALQDWLKIEQLHRQEILSRFQPEVVVRVESQLEQYANFAPRQIIRAKVQQAEK